MLIYIHFTFSRLPTTCLEHVKDTWPKDGILRVEIIKNAAQVNNLFLAACFVYLWVVWLQDYGIEQSYAKEEKLKQERVEDLSSMLELITKDGFVNIEPSTAEKNSNSETEPLQEDYESEY